MHFLQKLLASFLSLLLFAQFSVFAPLTLAQVSSSVGTTYSINLSDPTGTQVESIGSKTKVTWNPSPHEEHGFVDYYKVFYKKSVDPAYNPANFAVVYPATADNEVLIDALEIGSNYDFYVQAFDPKTYKSCDTGCDSCEVKNFTTEVRLSPPTTVLADSTNEAGEAVVSWKVQDDASLSIVTKFRVFHKKTADADFVNFQDVPKNGSSLSYSTLLIGLTDSENYDFKVIAMDEADNASDDLACASCRLENFLLTKKPRSGGSGGGSPSSPSAPAPTATTPPAENQSPVESGEDETESQLPPAEEAEVLEEEEIVPPPTEPKISQLTAGPSVSDRASFESGELITFLSSGSDGLISFAWTGDGDDFYYKLDNNPSGNSIAGKTANADGSTTDSWLDLTTALSNGLSYFHLQPASGDVFGAEQVFAINYSDTINPVLESITTKSADGTYLAGDDIDLTLSFSESVISESGILLELNSGVSLDIAPWSKPISSLELSYPVDAWQYSARLDVTAVIGSIADTAGNLVTPNNPKKSLFSTANLKIGEVSLGVVGQSGVSVYSTNEAQISVVAKAAAADEMYFFGSGLAPGGSVALDTWIPYSAAPQTLRLNDVSGARLIRVQFRKNGSALKPEASLVVSRTIIVRHVQPDEQAEEETQEVIEKITEDLTSKITEKLKSDATGSEVATEVLDLMKDKAVQTVNPAILTELAGELKKSDAAEVEDLTHQITENISKLDKLRALRDAGQGDQLLAELTTHFSAANMKLDDLVSVEELNTFLSALPADVARNEVCKFVDSTRITLDIKDGRWTASILTLGECDTDGDGLSDLIEQNLGTNPYDKDTDDDGFGDGLEVLDMGTDPLVPNTTVDTKFVKLQDEQVLTDGNPVLRGTGEIGKTLEIFATSSTGERVSLGAVEVDDESKWLLATTSDLTAGSYTLELASVTESQIYDQKRVVIDLDFILPAPEVFPDFTATGQTRDGSYIFAEEQPVIIGNTYYGSTVVASFQSLLTSTSIIADNPQGDFEIKPHRKLEPGLHKMTIYAELPDGTRSAAKIMHFVVQPDATTKNSFFWLLVALVGVNFLVMISGGGSKKQPAKASRRAA